MVKRNLLTAEQGKCERSKNRAIKDTLSAEHLFYSHLWNRAEFFIMSHRCLFKPSTAISPKMSIISLGVNAKSGNLKLAYKNISKGAWYICQENYILEFRNVCAGGWRM